MNRWLASALLSASVGVLSIPASASAAAVTATPASPWPGASVRLEASGFAPRAGGVASLTGARRVRFRVNSRGRATVFLRLPGSARRGLRNLRVQAGRRKVSTTMFVEGAQRAPSTMVALSGGQRLSLDPASGPAGARFSLRATGFARRSLLAVTLGGASVARTRTNARGALTIAGSVPAVAVGLRVVRVRAGRTNVSLRFFVLPPPPPPAPEPPPLETRVIAAAGDIACSPSDPNSFGGEGTPAGHCRQKATSDLLVGKGYSDVLTLGDTQYECATAAEFAGSFEPTWGRLKDIIRPVVGNHEYECDISAGGYFGYFGAAAGDPSQGYYSFEIGNWHVIALNTNVATAAGCPVVSCAAGSPQEQWLRADLAAHRTACTLAIWHHPRFSSRLAQPSPAIRPFWDALHEFGADVVLNGHVHHYERFNPQLPDATADPAGITQFVVGSGGHTLESTTNPMFAPAANRAAATQTFGVLELTLKPASYDWRFLTAAGQAAFDDAGSAACH